MGNAFQIGSTVNGRISKLLMVYDVQSEEQTIVSCIEALARKDGLTENATIYIMTKGRPQSQEIISILKSKNIDCAKASENRPARCIVFQPSRGSFCRGCFSHYDDSPPYSRRSGYIRPALALHQQNMDRPPFGPIRRKRYRPVTGLRYPLGLTHRRSL